MFVFFRIGLVSESTFACSSAEVAYMDNFSDPTSWGVLLPLDDLQACLRSVSHHEHQWTAFLEQEATGEWQTPWHRCVSIRYKNPELTDMPNEITYLFPAFVDSLFWEPSILICLHPSLAVPVVKGLYFEDEALKYDLLGDWDKFWTPLREALSSAGTNLF